MGVAQGASDIWRPLAQVFDGTAQAARSDYRVGAIVSDDASLNAALQRAAVQGRTAVVYFTADWCVTCRVIERDVLPDRAVAKALDEADLIKVDVTSNNEAVRGIMARYGVVGPPTVLFVGTDGIEDRDARLVGTITTDGLLKGIAGVGEVTR